MNEGQRRYAMEQWKLARIRRGEKFDAPTIFDANEQEYIDNFDLDFLGSPSTTTGGPEVEENQEDQAIEDFLDQITANQNNRMETPPQTPSSSRSGPPAPKRLRMGTNLPGTGGNLDGMASGQPADQSLTNIQRPIGLKVDKMTKTYTKKWRFLTSANANVILDDPANPATNRPGRWALTTALANIPWEYLFLYMTPAEYNRVKAYPGTFAKHCSITVKAWNTRVAFQTGDTQSSNATLNQNKFIQVAKGIRSIPFIASSNRRYIFLPTDPMEPSGFENQTSAVYRENLKIAMYGYDNNSTNFKNAPPAEATGGEMYLQDYLTIYTNKAPPLLDNTLQGFPPLKNFIEEFDASQCIDRNIAHMEYNFKYAPIVPHFDSVNNSKITRTATSLVTPGTINETSSVKSQDASQSLYPHQTFNVGRRYITGPGKDQTYFTEELNYFKYPLEQDGVFEEIHTQTFGDSQQPSFHIGVRAVPKLTTIDSTVQPNSFLDAQGYFEVECKLITESVDPYTYIKQGCFSSNNKTQLQHFDGDRPMAKFYDYPNEYGRMSIIKT